MEYFHHERPDIVTPHRENSLFGLSTATSLAAAPLDDHASQSSQSQPLDCPPPTNDTSTPPTRRTTAMSVLGSIAEGQRDRQAMLKTITEVMKEPRRRSGADHAATPDTQRTMASMFLSRLEANEEVCEDEEALRVVEHAASVLHGTLQGAAELMASRICVMAELSLSPQQCVARLRTFARKRAVRDRIVSVVGDGDGSGAGGGE